MSTENKEAQPRPWKCKLCTMDNNEYIPYCEICLVPKNIQTNKTNMKKLQQKLKSNNNKFLNAQTIRDIAKLFNQFETNIKRLKDVQTNKTVIYDIQKEIQNFCNKTNLECDKNIVQDFITKYNICDDEKFSQQKKLNQYCAPICKCGTEMLVTDESKCYELDMNYSCVICDICNQVIESKDTVFHCPKQKLNKIHSDGFDICKKCRKKYVHRLRYFVALIICPNMVDKNGKIELNDHEKLITMFKKLGFHKIICLKGDDATKQKVERAIKNILPSNSKNNKLNINQFTTICYSGHGEVIGNTYYFALDRTDSSTWVCSESIKNHCQATVNGSVSDGIKNIWNEMWGNKYYRHNTLLLINSCYSGGAGRIIEAQRIADSFGITMSWMIGLISMKLGLGAMSAAAIREIGVYASDSVTISKVWDLLGICAAEIGPEAISPEFIIGWAVVAGVGIISAIVIYLSVTKSTNSESLALVASCDKIETSNACYPTSPFIKYVTEFFDTFLGGNNDNMKSIFEKLKIDCDSPEMLFKYLQERYKEKLDSLGGCTLNALNQTVKYNYRGFQQFAMCPVFNQ